MTDEPRVMQCDPEETDDLDADPDYDDDDIPESDYDDLDEWPPSPRIILQGDLT